MTTPSEEIPQLPYASSVASDPAAAAGLQTNLSHASRWGAGLAAYLVLIASVTALFFRCGQLERIGSFLSGDFYTFYIAVTLVGIGWLGWRRVRLLARPVAWWPLDIVLASSLIVDAILKPIFNSPRPRGGHLGFPSGHTEFSFALAWLVMELEPRLAPTWFACAIAIAWSRVEVYAHYPYQVLAGAPLGMLVAWAAANLPDGLIAPRVGRSLQRWLKRRAVRPGLS